jgi:hypothetical protein
MSRFDHTPSPCQSDPEEEEEEEEKEEEEEEDDDDEDEEGKMIVRSILNSPTGAQLSFFF